jgi:hypothetical protein
MKVLKDQCLQTDVAEHFGVSTVTIWRWAKAGCPMPARKQRQGKPMIFTPADIKRIEQWHAQWREESIE